MADSARDRAIEAARRAGDQAWDESPTRPGGSRAAAVAAVNAALDAITSPEVLRALAGEAGAPDTPPADDRCPSCEHKRGYHSTPGCWYAVTVGTVGKAMNCACGLTDWPASDTPPADELDELDISGGPEHRVTKHWDNEGGEVIWRSCSCGHDWTTADVEVCPEAPYADDEHGVAWSTIKSLAARVDRHEVDEHEAADVIVRALRAGAGAS